MTGLRKILKIQPTHLDNTWTNKKAYDLANEAFEKVNPKTVNKNNKGIFKSVPLRSSSKSVKFNY